MDRILLYLPRLANFIALLVWALLLYLIVTSGASPLQPYNLLFLVALALAYLSILFAQDSQRPMASTLLWLSAGLWSAAAYMNFQLIGFLYLIVALLAVGGAVGLERERGGFSLTGPAAFVVAAIVMVALGNVLTPT